LLSNLAPANEQGATIGVAQSAGSLARILGPLFAVILYLRVAPLPYVFCGGLSILAALLTWQYLCREKIMGGLRVGAPDFVLGRRHAVPPKKLAADWLLHTRLLQNNPPPFRSLEQNHHSPGGGPAGASSGGAG
jgi:hypothetical protein